MFIVGLPYLFPVICFWCSRLLPFSLNYCLRKNKTFDNHESRNIIVSFHCKQILTRHNANYEHRSAR
jgi:hypothetical protein